LKITDRFTKIKGAPWCIKAYYACVLIDTLSGPVGCVSHIYLYPISVI